MSANKGKPVGQPMTTCMEIGNGKRICVTIATLEDPNTCQQTVCKDESTNSCESKIEKSCPCEEKDQREDPCEQQDDPCSHQEDCCQEEDPCQEVEPCEKMNEDPCKQEHHPTCPLYEPPKGC